jgi:AraC-like DNA-binding protein
LTWVELPSLHLLRAQEASARLAYLRLPPGKIFVTFLTQKGLPLICSGAELQFGDIMFHSRGERGHQRTTARTRWGCVSLTPASLLTFGETIAGRSLVPPPSGCIIRPISTDLHQLLRLHAQAGRIAETNLARIGHKEVVRAMEQDLIFALVKCLATCEIHEDQPTRRHQAAVLVQLEAVLAANPFRILRTRELCSAIGVSEQTLRASCARVLGMTADRYQRLRRLKLVRTELMATNRAAANVAEVISRYGFADLHRFVTEYWDAYGEMPPIPPRDSTGP